METTGTPKLPKPEISKLCTQATAQGAAGRLLEPNLGIPLSPKQIYIFIFICVYIYIYYVGTSPN